MRSQRGSRPDTTHHFSQGAHTHTHTHTHTDGHHHCACTASRMQSSFRSLQSHSVRFNPTWSFQLPCHSLTLVPPGWAHQTTLQEADARRSERARGEGNRKLGEARNGGRNARLWSSDSLSWVAFAHLNSCYLPLRSGLNHGQTESQNRSHLTPNRK